MSPAATSAGDATPATIRVDLGERSYDILIGSGLLARAGQEIASRLPKSRVAIVTDETVASLHLAALAGSLTRAGIGHAAIAVPPGEGSKSFGMLDKVTNEILGARMERGDVVVALGGGVVGDLAGFASGIVRRGMHLVQVPTTLLAQVDSSVGGKTGINTHHGKNLVGVFHQPRLVLADTAVLDTLPARHFRAGYAEVAKVGLIGDADFFAWLEANWNAVFDGGADRRHAIAVACAFKAKLVMADERETGDRALLNLGHTFAHALEAATGYSDRLVHGEAVALGIILAFRFSAHRGLCSPGDASRVAAHFAGVGLPTKLSEVSGGLPGPKALLDLIAQDKKVSRGKLTFILVRAVGQAFVERDVAPDSVLEFLEAQLRPGSATT
jgi:3-dehydroquinate synthase